MIQKKNKKMDISTSMLRGLEILLLILAGWLVKIPILHGQSENWSKPINLSSGSEFAWFPDITVDLGGRIHVVWTTTTLPTVGSPLQKDEKKTYYDQVIYTTSLDGEIWSSWTDITAYEVKAGVEATRPALLTDKHGRFHMTSRYNRIYYIQTPVNLVLSIAPSLLPRKLSYDFSYYSRLAIDKNDTLHLVYTEFLPDEKTINQTRCLWVLYRQSTDNGQSWSKPINISKLPTGSAKPQILIDSQNYIHVVWESGEGGDIGQLYGIVKVMYTASYDNGITWTSPAQFTTKTTESAKSIAIGLDNKDNLLVAWLSLPENRIYYQLSYNHGHSWTPPQLLPGVFGGVEVFPSRLDDYAMATDNAGNIHLVFVGTTVIKEKSLSVFHMMWNGLSWSKAEPITTLLGDVPEWPRIAIGKGNELHVVWFVRNEEGLWGNGKIDYKVWYSKAMISAPLLPTVTWPTVTPTATPTITPIPTIIPTATPTPTLSPKLLKIEPSVAQAIQTVYTDFDELTLLIVSLTPAFLIVFSLVTAIRIWKHRRFRN